MQTEPTYNFIITTVSNDRQKRSYSNFWLTVERARKGSGHNLSYYSHRKVLKSNLKCQRVGFPDTSTDPEH